MQAEYFAVIAAASMLLFLVTPASVFKWTVTFPPSILL